MSDIIVFITTVRILILTLGALITVGAAMKALFTAFSLPRSVFRSSFIGLGTAIFLLGVVLLGFAVTDIFKYTTDEAWATLGSTLVGFAGAFAILLFVWVVSRIKRYTSGG